jgi:hypothetical protein
MEKSAVKSQLWQDSSLCREDISEENLLNIGLGDALGSLDGSCDTVGSTLANCH